MVKYHIDLNMSSLKWEPEKKSTKISIRTTFYEAAAYKMITIKLNLSPTTELVIK